MKKYIYILIAVLSVSSLLFLGIGCKEEAVEEAVEEVEEAVEEAVEEVEEAVEEAVEEETTEFKPEEKNIYFMTTLLSHPVMRLMTLGFFTEATELGYKPKLAGTLDYDDVGTIQAGEQIIAQGADGMVIFAFAEVYFPLIEKARQAGIPVIVPQVLWPEGDVPGITANIGLDAKKYSRDMVDALAEKLNYKGTIAPTIGHWQNPIEVTINDEFRRYCNEEYDDIIVLETLEIGAPGEEAEGTSKVVAHILANPEINAGFNSSAQGAEVWVNAFDETNREDIYFIGMDYIPKNLDYLRAGKIYGLVGQPFYELLQSSAVTLDKILRGEEVPYQTIVDTPIITQDTPEQVEFYYELQKNMDEELDRLGGKI